MAGWMRLKLSGPIPTVIFTAFSSGLPDASRPHAWQLFANYFDLFQEMMRAR